MLMQIFESFVLIGLGAYGGGLVTIPLIQHELVYGRQWIAFDEMVRILAIAQMTPGPIAVNAATYTGYRVSGILGAAVATGAVIVPAMIILTVLMPWVERFRNNDHARRLRKGLQIGVLSLILFAVWSYGRAAVSGWSDVPIAVSSFIVLTVLQKKIHPIAVIIAYGILGMVIFR